MHTQLSLQQVPFEDEGTKIKSGLERDSSPSCKKPQDRDEDMIGSNSSNGEEELLESTLEDITPPSQTYYDYKSPVPHITTSDVSAATPTKRKADLFSPLTMSTDSEEYDADKENNPPVDLNLSRTYNVNSKELCDDVIKTSNTSSKLCEPSQFTKEMNMINNPSSNSLNPINLDSVTVCLEDQFNAVDGNVKEEYSESYIPKSGFSEMNNDQSSSFDIYEDSGSETLSQGKASVCAIGSFVHDVLDASQLENKEKKKKNRTDLAQSLGVMSDDGVASPSEPQTQNCIVEAKNCDVELNESDSIQVENKRETESIDSEKVFSYLENMNNQNTCYSGKIEEIDENNQDCNMCSSQNESEAKNFAPGENGSNRTDNESECNESSGDCSAGHTKLSIQEVNKQMRDCNEFCGATEIDSKTECNKIQGNPDISNLFLYNANSDQMIDNPESHAAVVTVGRAERLEMQGDPEVKDPNPFDNKILKKICEECPQSCEQFSTDDESKNTKKQGNHQVKDLNISDEVGYQEIEQCRESCATDDKTKSIPESCVADDETECTQTPGASLDGGSILFGDKSQKEVDQFIQQISDRHDEDSDLTQNSMGNSKVSFATSSTMKLIHRAKTAHAESGNRSSTVMLGKETSIVTKKVNRVDSTASREEHGQNSTKPKESDCKSVSNEISSTKKQVKNEFVRQTSLLFDKGNANVVKSKVDSGLSGLSKNFTSIKDRKLFWQQQHNHTNGNKNESFLQDAAEQREKTNSKHIKSDDDRNQKIEGSGRSSGFNVSDEVQGRSSRSLSPCSKLQKEWVQSTNKKRQHVHKPQVETIDQEEMESFRKGICKSNTKPNFSKLMAKWSGKDNVSNSERRSNNSNVSAFVKTLTPTMTLDLAKENEKSHSSKAICFMNEFLE